MIYYFCGKVKNQPVRKRKNGKNSPCIFVIPEQGIDEFIENRRNQMKKK